MARTFFKWVVFLAATLATLPALVGCGHGVSQGTSYFPYIIPGGEVAPTHARPPGTNYTVNYDPHAVKIEVFPMEATNPVRTQHVFIATVLDETGQPRRNRRVEWMLDGVGSIVEVDESGLFNGKGGKINNEYAVSYTDYHEQVITRGNDDPSDDFTVKPGQTWCVITSAIEGDSHLTVFCPEIHNWDNHKVYVTKHWVDAEWVFPKPAINRAGTTHVFTTNVFRHTDHQPLSGYKVKYKIIDGPPGFFTDNKGQEFTTVSDLNGNASVTLAQVAPAMGVNRIAVEIIRPPVAGVASGVGIVIGKGETTKEWQAPSVQLTKEGPRTAVKGQEIPYTLTITNSGKVETKSLTVRDTIPQSLQFVRADPEARLDGTDLVWTLGELPGGQSRTIQVVFRSTQLGTVTNTATVIAEEGMKDQKTITTEVVSPDLKVTKTGPPTGVIGMPISYEVVVTNTGSGPATNVLLRDEFDQALEHESKANPVELPVGTLDAGKSRTVKLQLTPRQAGVLKARVLATADGGLRSEAQHPVNVSEAKLLLKLSGPKERYVGRPADYVISVKNPGDMPLTNVVVRDQLPAEVKFKSASAGGKAENGVVVWNVGTLGPKEEKQVQVTGDCTKMTPEAVNVATGTADPGATATDQSALEIRGLPAFRLEVQDLDDPVEKTAETTYQVNVTNQGSLPGNQVQIVATLPKQMKFVKAEGPSAFKVEVLATRTPEEGETIIFEPVDSMKPGETYNYAIRVKTLETGDVRFKTKLLSQSLSKAVNEEESTNIYAPPTGGIGATPAATPQDPISVTPTPVTPTPAPLPPPAAPTPAPLPAPGPLVPEPTPPMPAAPAPAPLTVPVDTPAPSLPPAPGASLSSPRPGGTARPGAPIATSSGVVPASASGSAKPPQRPAAVAPAPAPFREPPGTTPLPR